MMDNFKDYDLSRMFVDDSDYEVLFEDGIFRLTDNVSKSEFIFEVFDNSFQIRQAVYFNCDQLSGDKISEINKLCSRVNSRFSGCKNYIDEWNVLITVYESLHLINDIELIKIVLNQVEFVSEAMLAFMGNIENDEVLSDEQIDRVFLGPTLQ
ncbi:hypothetical protein [Sphingomonas soli]|uniref:hypothetical protein n=1 Tax=Sphingomonas soli TaxID=266127 RepID=UPI0012EDF032|nr:hypothetical protein [Sphingomonas soli]